MSRRAKLLGTAHVAAALVGTLPGAFFASVALARRLPFALETRFSIGFLALLVLWVGALCWVWRSHSAGRAWLWCLSVALPSGALAYL
ncbi:MAG: hypothetical protein H6718_28895 [Polyangiaceae bacterium]|nr:hypothetical protein [Myxococcales bacterium]MCB9589466.1 hypothetical protein [Polyangiaceae bacterium]